MRPTLPWLLLLLSACATSGTRVPAAQSSAPVASEPVTGPFGTEHPFVFQLAAPDGSWVLACQARADTNGDGRVEVFFGHHGNSYGDALEPYLFLGPGEGQRIDDFIGSDTSGRYVALVRDGVLRLVDTRTRAEQELARLRPSERAEMGDDAWVPAPVADFSPDGRRVLFLREEKEGHVVAVVRELASGEERRLDAGPGELRRAAFDPSGQWALLSVLDEDTDKNGVLNWPQAQTTLAPAHCRGPVAVSSFYGYKGDQPERRFRRVDGSGPLVDAQDVLQPMGSWLLRRGPQGELFVTAPDGSKRTEWVPAACKASIQFVDTERRQVLVACDAKTQPAPLELHGETVHQPLGVSADAKARDYLFNEPHRLLTFDNVRFRDKDTPAGTSVSGVVDLEQRKVSPQPPHMRLVFSQGPHALLTEDMEEAPGARPGMRLWLLDADTGQRSLLGEGLPSYAWFAAGDLFLFRGLLVDLRAGRLLGRVEGEPLAIDTHGRVLRLPSKPERDEPHSQALHGPARWEPLATP